MKGRQSDLCRIGCVFGGVDVGTDADDEAETPTFARV